MADQPDDLAKLHGRLQELRVICGQIGQPPKPPPTLRGKVGAALVLVVRRLLFWYTPPLQTILEGLTRVVDDLVQTTRYLQDSLDQTLKTSCGPDLVLLEERLQAQVMERERLQVEEWKEWLRQEGVHRENPNYLQQQLRCDSLEEDLRQEHRKREEIENRLREQGETLLRECLRSDELEKSLRQEYLYREGLESRLQEQGLRINGSEDYLQLLRTQTDTLEQERRRMTEMFQQERLCTIELEGRLREQVDEVQQLQDEQHEDRLQKIEERLQILRRELMEQTRRVSRLLEEARKRLPAPLDREQLKVFEEEDAHDLDSLYLAFGEAFRGLPEEIQARLKVYLPLLQKAKTESREFTILDVGCGRGDWLESAAPGRISGAGRGFQSQHGGRMP